jgi:prepilin-type N-terminal cleavage/methylation domain-containing protein
VNRTSGTDDGRPRGTRGFTLVELAVAIVLLVVGFLALAQVTLTIRTMKRADDERELAANALLDQLHAIEWVIEADSAYLLKLARDPIPANGCQEANFAADGGTRRDCPIMRPRAARTHRRAASSLQETNVHSRQTDQARLDANGQTLGRLATRIADTLRGKTKPSTRRIATPATLSSSSTPRRSR